MSKTIIFLCIALSLIVLSSGQRRNPDRNRWIPEDLPVTYGCFMERCWSRCSRIGLHGEWCWTAENRRDNYKACRYASDCRPDMVCGGPCTRLRKW